MERMFVRRLLELPGLVRTYATKRESFRGRRSDAGVGRRFRALRQTGHEVEVDKLQNDADLGFHEDEYFQKVDSVHREDNSVEKMGMTPAMEFRMVERKYFPERVKKEPNLLTWIAKEKIRYLHHLEPETWTPERLAHSFPCSVRGVKHVLKSKWTPKDEEELRKHDEAVAEEWKILGKKFGGPLSEKVQDKVITGALGGGLLEPRSLISGRKAESLPDDGEFFGLLAERAKPWQEDMNRKDVLRLMATTEKGDSLIERRAKSFFRSGNRRLTQVDPSPKSNKIRFPTRQRDHD